MRLRRLTGLGVVAASVAALAACSDGDGGTPVINVYGSTSDAGWSKILDACNAAAQGRYTIRPNLIPSDADSQREQFVRRLAARDEGMDVLGMDVTWTAEFAEAGWIRELTGEQAQAATDGVLQQPIDTGSDAVYILTVRVYVFDSDQHANAGWKSTVNSTAILNARMPAASPRPTIGAKLSASTNASGPTELDACPMGRTVAA